MREIPIVRDGLLTRGEADEVIVVGSSAWFAWLQSVAFFVVAEPIGRFTMRRERGPQGNYWYAYRRNRGALRRAYVGQTADITVTQLRQSAESLGHNARLPAPAQPPRYARVARDEQPAGLLTTKLLMPPLRAALIERPFALSRLHQALEYPLTILSAPAGYGKATLLAQWIAMAQLRVAWVSLDSGDADATRFWSYVIAALEPLVPGLTRLLLPTIQTPTPHLDPDDLAALINLLTTTPHPVILVLDNYHAIGTATTIHDNLIFIVDHLPPNAHIVLAGRSDPPLPLARLRAHGQLNELHTADLQFTLDEATRFLTRTLGVVIPTAEIAQLYDHIEGWITGWQLAALSFQGRDDIPALAGSFDGRNRYIIDFLTAEVLQNLPPERLRFLLQTAILDPLTASLCDAVTGMDDGQATLEEFERDHLFLEPLDAEHQWYRYHHSFAEALRLIGRQTHPARVPELYRRAGRWYEAHGESAAAIAAAFMAGDQEEAARIIATVAASTLTNKGTSRLEQWLSRLPEGLVRGNPTLAVAHAYVLLLSGRFKQFERQIMAAEHNWKPTNARRQCAEDALLQGVITALSATVAALQGHHLQCQALARQAQATLQAMQALDHPAMVNLGIAFWLNGDTVLAAQMLDDVRRRSEQQGNVFYLSASAAYLARVLVEQGRLREAIELCHAVIAHPHREALSPENATISTYLGIALYQRNELDQAAYHLEHSLAHAPSLMSMTDGACALAGIHHARGDSSGAAQIIARLQADLPATEPFWAAFVGAYQVRLWALQGDIEEAGGWVAEHADDERAQWANVPLLLRDYERLVLAHIYRAQGRFSDVLRLTAELRATAEEDRRMGRVLEALVLEAVAHDARDDAAQAFAALRRALLIAAPEGNVQAFVMGGGAVRRLLLALRATPDLLAEAQPLRRLPDFVDMVLASIGGEGKSQATQVAMSANYAAQRRDAHPVVALSAREREVLRLLARGASNQDLARALVIEMGTVKRHLSNIYAKLGVQSRVHAIARAYALGLLDA